MYISPYHGSETSQEDGKRGDFSLSPPPLRKIIAARGLGLRPTAGLGAESPEENNYNGMLRSHPA